MLFLASHHPISIKKLSVFTYIFGFTNYLNVFEPWYFLKNRFDILSKTFIKRSLLTWHFSLFSRQFILKTLNLLIYDKLLLTLCSLSLNLSNLAWTRLRIAWFLNGRFTWLIVTKQPAYQSFTFYLLSKGKWLQQLPCTEN